jgi:hypothetical protein
MPLALAVALAFGFAGCPTSTEPGGGGDNNGGDDPVLTGAVTITGTAKVGQRLTADIFALEGSGTISYQWKKTAASDGEYAGIEGVASSSRRPSSAQVTPEPSLARQ